MNKELSMLKHGLITVVLATVSCTAFAQDFVQNDIGYKIMEDGLVCVTQAPIYGRIEIPSHVRHAGRDYAVKKIGDGVFSSCKNLHELYLPETVDELGNNVMADCPNLSVVDVKGKIIMSGSGVLKNSAWMDNNNDAMPVLGGCVLACRDSVIGHLDLQEGVVSVADYVFSGQKHIDRITFPSTMLSVGSHAFDGCISLEQMDGLDKLKHAGNLAFYNTAWYVNLPQGVTYVGDALVRATGDIYNLIIPEGISRIDSYAMSDNYSDTERYFDEMILPTSLTDIADNVAGSARLRGTVFCLSDKLDLHNNVISGEAIVKAKRHGDFIYNRQAPSGASWLGDSINVILRYIGKSGYVVMPETIEGSPYAIGPNVMKHADRPCEIAFRKSKAHILDYARLASTSMNLDGVLSVGISGVKVKDELTVGSSLEKVSRYAFEMCSDLQTVNWNAPWCEIIDDGNQPHWQDDNEGLFYSCRELNVGGSVKNILPYFCTRNNNLTKVSLPYGLKEIGDYAFYVCRGLEEIDLPDGLEHIGRSAFDYCTDISALTMPEGLDSVSLEGCIGLKTLSVPSTAKYVSLNGCSHLEKLVMKPVTPPEGDISNVPYYSCSLEAPEGYENAYKAVMPWSQFVYNNQKRAFATGIEGIDADASTEVYDVAGRRSDIHGKGVRIVRNNGKSIKIVNIK